MKNFLSWMEGEESPALAEPQHKKGEGNLRLDDITERRIRQMIMDLESSGKGTKEEVLASMMKNMKKMGVKEEDPSGKMQQNQDNSSQQESPPNMLQSGLPQGSQPSGQTPTTAATPNPAGLGVVRPA